MVIMLTDCHVCHVLTTTSAIPIKVSAWVSWGGELQWLWWPKIITVNSSCGHNYISYTYRILKLGIMRWRIAMVLINGYHVSVSRIHNYISYTYPILNLGIMGLALAMINGSRLSCLNRHVRHVLTTTPALPIKFSTLHSWGWKWLWLWSMLIMLKSSRVHNYMSSTYQILNLGIMRLRIAMAMIIDYQVEVIKYSQLDQRYLPNSQPRKQEVDSGYGYDQWLSCWSHHVSTTTWAIPTKFSTSVSWGWELLWLWSMVIMFLNLSIIEFRTAMALISGYRFKITLSQLHQLYLSNSQPRYHELENCYGYDQ